MKGLHCLREEGRYHYGRRTPRSGDNVIAVGIEKLLSESAEALVGGELLRKFRRNGRSNVVGRCHRPLPFGPRGSQSHSTNRTGLPAMLLWKRCPFVHS